jgi:hypothetical protein
VNGISNIEQGVMKERREEGKQGSREAGKQRSREAGKEEQLFPTG